MADNAVQFASHVKSHTDKPLRLRKKSEVDGRASNGEKCVAGMVGFEPTVHCTKNSCLTTWLHPNVETLFKVL